MVPGIYVLQGDALILQRCRRTVSPASSDLALLYRRAAGFAAAPLGSECERPEEDVPEIRDRRR